ncbi:MAG: DinB family protein [Promethearchaeota archaeon]
MSAVIEMLVNHNIVCRDPLFQVLDRLGTEEFLKPTGAGKGSIRDILVHIMNTEKFWIAYLKDTKTEMRRPSDFHDIQSIRDEWSGVSDDTEEFMRDLTEDQLFQVKSMRTGYQTISFTIAKALLHMTTHETHHRGFLIGFIRQKGLDPPDVNML